MLQLRMHSMRHVSNRQPKRQYDCTVCMAQIAVVLSEKTDTTITKGVLRIIGSVVGGVFGALAFHSSMADKNTSMLIIIC